MKIIIAPDKFKGTLSAPEACDAIEKGILQALPHYPSTSLNIIKVPMADGGEGTLESIIASRGRFIDSASVDALGRETATRYGEIRSADIPCGISRFDTQLPIAVIEAASTIGLAMLAKEERNPLHTSSFGLGITIKDAIAKGFRQFIITIGGSATNDAGAGMLAALGCRFYDISGKQQHHLTGGTLRKVCTIDTSGLRSLTSDCLFTVACDVSNPLLGASGATMVYSAQKGATPQAQSTLEEGVEHFSQIAAVDMQDIVPNAAEFTKLPGAGAAGGIGWALALFLNAEIASGAELVGSLLNLPELIYDADIIITGEGKFDDQSTQGKVISYVCNIADNTPSHPPVVAYCGTAGNNISPDSPSAAGIYSLYTTSSFAGFEQSMTHPSTTLTATVAQTFRKLTEDLAVK